MFQGISQEYDFSGALKIPRLLNIGFLIRFGVVCLLDLAVKKIILVSKLLVMVYDEIMYIKYDNRQLNQIIPYYDIRLQQVLQRPIMSASSYPQFMVLKDKGNDCYQKKQFRKSIQYYNLAIEKNGSYLQAYSNRALAYYFLKEYELSQRDCNLILKDNPKNIKSLYRKAVCRMQFMQVYQALDLLLQVEQLQRKKKYTKDIQKVKKMIDETESFLKSHKRQSYKEAQQNINVLNGQIDGTDELRFYKADCCMHLYNKETIQAFFKDLISSKYQCHFLYWYLKAKFDLIHCNKHKAKRYIYESVRLKNRMPISQEISKIMLYYKEEVEILCKKMEDLQIKKEDRQRLFKFNKYKECADKCTEILKFNIINLEQKIETYEKRSLCYKELKEYPKRFSDIVCILKLQPNCSLGLHLRYNFYIDQYRYTQAKRDVHKLKDSQPQKFMKISREIDQKMFKKRIKYPTYYDVLEIAPFSGETQIKRAYKDLAIIYHPDKNILLQPEARLFAAQKFADIQKVYEVLTDPKQRTIYDRAGEQQQDILKRKNEQMRQEFISLFKNTRIQMPGDNVQYSIQKKAQEKELSRLPPKEKEKILAKKRQEQVIKSFQSAEQAREGISSEPNLQQKYTTVMNELNANLKKGNIAPYQKAINHFKLNPLSAQRMSSLPIFNALNPRNRMTDYFKTGFKGIN